MQSTIFPDLHHIWGLDFYEDLLELLRRLRLLMAFKEFSRDPTEEELGKFLGIEEAGNLNMVFPPVGHGFRAPITLNLEGPVPMREWLDGFQDHYVRLDWITNRIMNRLVGRSKKMDEAEEEAQKELEEIIKKIGEIKNEIEMSMHGTSDKELVEETFLSEVIANRIPIHSSLLANAGRHARGTGKINPFYQAYLWLEMFRQRSSVPAGIWDIYLTFFDDEVLTEVIEGGIEGDQDLEGYISQMMLEASEAGLEMRREDTCRIFQWLIGTAMEGRNPQDLVRELGERSGIATPQAIELVFHPQGATEENDQFILAIRNNVANNGMVISETNTSMIMAWVVETLMRGVHPAEVIEDFNRGKSRFVNNVDVKLPFASNTLKDKILSQVYDDIKSFQAVV